jgi:hypothetical protein
LLRMQFTIPAIATVQIHNALIAFIFETWRSSIRCSFDHE